jgi:hypothetical protein
MTVDANKAMPLMQPMFQGNKDEYGKEAVPSLPFSFDRNLEGRPPSTSAPLFGLPYGVLSIVISMYHTP